MLKLIPAPHRRAIFEKEMRYEFVLDGKVVGEAYFNMRGYVSTGLDGPLGLKGFIGHEQSLSATRREVAHWNRENQPINV